MSKWTRQETCQGKNGRLYGALIATFCRVYSVSQKSQPFGTVIIEFVGWSDRSYCVYAEDVITWGVFNRAELTTVNRTGLACNNTIERVITCMKKFSRNYSGRNICRVIVSARAYKLNMHACVVPDMLISVIVGNVSETSRSISARTESVWNCQYNQTNFTPVNCMG